MGQWTAELQQQVAEDQRQMQAEQRRQHVEVLQLKEALEVREVMMTEFASMAMGQEYQRNKGYHDSEMYDYAKAKWENQQEVARMEALQRENRRLAALAVAETVEVPSENEWDASMAEETQASGSQRARVRNPSAHKSRGTAKMKKHGFD